MSKKAKRREEARLQSMKHVESPQTVPEHHQKREQTGAKKFFDMHYKHIMLIPTILIILSLLQIGWHISSTGDFVTKSASLSGGSIITIPWDDAQGLETYLRERHADAHIRVAQSGAQSVVQSIYTDQQPVEQLTQDILNHVGELPKSAYTVEIIGASLGKSFFRQTMISLLIAFAFMSTVVFISFRSPAPTFFVVLAAACDILTTLAVFNILGQELTIAGIAAFLMLIGYSIDTDVLLTTRVLRRKGTITDATFSALGTGLTMSIATAMASLAGILLTKSETMHQIMLIIFIGMMADMIYTWLQNAPILKWYLERKAKQEAHHG